MKPWAWFIALSAVSGVCAYAQIPFFGSQKTLLHRTLPAAIELDARTFSITAVTNVNDPRAKQLAGSLGEMLRAKIQGDSRFVMTDRNPALKVSVAITRFYIEPKELARPGKNAGTCKTHLGNLQGTFTIIETATGKPLASDAIAWKLADGRTKYWLESEDKRQVPVEGPQEKLGFRAMWEFAPEEGGRGLPIKNPLTKEPHPCDSPLTENQAIDVLADAFLADLVHLAVPYEATQEVPLEGGKFKKLSEDMAGGRWENAREELEKMGQLQKAGDEAARLYLIGLAHEMTGYKLGKQIFDAHQKITKDTPAEETSKIQSDIRGLVTQAKRAFDDSATSYKQASELGKDKAYRDAERRADQSRNLYVRIGRYNELKPRAIPVPPQSPPATPPSAPATKSPATKSPATKSPAAPAPVGLTMKEITTMCTQGLAQSIIVDRIARAKAIAATPEDAGELTKCAAKQTAIYEALTKRWDAKQ